MSDGDRLLRAILEDPRDDELRLVWADWLEEHGDAGRAEFVRLQLAIADAERHCRCGRTGSNHLFAGGQRHNGPCAGDRVRVEAGGRSVRARDRERELLTAVCRDCSWHAPAEHGGWSWTFRRGLVEEVTLPAHVFLNTRVTAALFSSQPLLKVTLRGKRPLKEEGDEYYCWTDHRGRLTDTPSWEVPRPLFELLLPDRKCVRVRDSSFTHSTRGYATEADALAALSAAAVRLGRRTAGLSELEV